MHEFAYKYNFNDTWHEFRVNLNSKNILHQKIIQLKGYLASNYMAIRMILGTK